MHDIFSPEPDPLEAMLRPPPPPDAEALRQRVYAQTRRVLRRRRSLRRMAFVAALAASFVLGLLVMRAAMRPPTAPPSPREVVEQPEAPRPANTPPAGEEPALVREWRAFDSDERCSELYRQAGDRYMTEESDPQSALRCYTNALDSGTEEETNISTDDNWLFMAIKDARKKEKDRAKNGG